MKSKFRRAPWGVALLLAAAAAHGQSYPDRPIQLIAQQPPGSGSDAMTRSWAECAGRELGQPIVVQNRPGANGVLAINQLKGQAADGYTLMTIGMSQMAITPYIFREPPYDPAKDFADAGVFATSPLIVTVPAALGVSRFSELVALGNAKAGGMDFGSPGNGSPAHLLTTALLERLGVSATHVPFVGESAGVTALIGDQIQMMTLVLSTAVPHVNSGKLKALAVISDERSALLPDVPTLAEAVPEATELSRPSWIAVVTKAGVPQDRLDRLAQATRACNQDEAYRARMQALNLKLVDAAPGQAQTWAQRDSALWRPMIERLGLVTQ